MDTDFAATLTEWHDFLAAVAGISGTLVGLLFVALGLRPAIMTDQGPTGPRVWAAHTFHSFLVLLVIGLVGLVPDDDGRSLAITLVILGSQGLVRVVTDLRQVRVSNDPQWRGRQGLLRFVSPALAYGFSLWMALGVWRGETGALDWLTAIVFLLMISAASSCWDLLREIGERYGNGTADGDA